MKYCFRKNTNNDKNHDYFSRQGRSFSERNLTWALLKLKEK
jgi:hypothetical protein